MSENFKKLKRKYLLGAVLKCLICGVSIGLLAVGAVLLALKLSAISLGVVWYILIGIGAAILGGGVAFVFFRPTDKKIATMLDNEFALEERVQTSLEFSGREGTIIELQREDAEERLKSLPKSKPKFSRIWQVCLIALISVAIAVAAFVVPAAQAEGPDGETPGPVDPTVEITPNDLMAVQNVLEDVRKADIKDGVKAAAVGELEELLLELEEVEKLSQLVSAINGTVTDVNDIFNGANTFETYREALLNVNLSDLAQAIYYGGNSYKTFKMMTYEDLETFYEEREASTREKMEESIGALRNTLKVRIGDGLAQKIFGLINSVQVALDSMEVVEGDPLYVALGDFMAALMEEYMSVDAITPEDVSTPPENEVIVFEGPDQDAQDRLDDVFANLNGRLVRELMSQSFHGATRRFIGNRLKSIFERYGLGNYEQPDPDTGSSGGFNPGDYNPGNTVGSGNVRGGTDDEIYDPRTGEYRKYMDVLDDYQQMVNEQIQDGKLTPEQANMARAFFEYLKKIEDNK